nr:DUF86 domain-containing protein [Candidatus Sigynarchaeota archaeon]
MKKPSTYRESFEILADSNIIPPSLADDLSDLAGFRNVLVHGYWKLNLKEVYSVLQKDFVFLEEFKRIVRDLLRS